MEDQVSPLMESLRLSVVEPFNALDQTMAKQEAVIGRETDGAGTILSFFGARIARMSL